MKKNHQCDRQQEVSSNTRLTRIDNGSEHQVQQRPSAEPQEIITQKIIY